MKKVAFKLKRNRTCSDDNIVAEMVTCLGDDVFQVLAEIFKLRLLNHVTEDEDESWSRVMVQCILKREDLARRSYDQSQ